MSSSEYDSSRAISFLYRLRNWDIYYQWYLAFVLIWSLQGTMVLGYVLIPYPLVLNLIFGFYEMNVVNNLLFLAMSISFAEISRMLLVGIFGIRHYYKYK